MRTISKGSATKPLVASQVIVICCPAATAPLGVSNVSVGPLIVKGWVEAKGANCSLLFGMRLLLKSEQKIKDVLTLHRGLQKHIEPLSKSQTLSQKVGIKAIERLTWAKCLEW